MSGYFLEVEARINGVRSDKLTADAVMVVKSAVDAAGYTIDDLIRSYKETQSGLLAVNELEIQPITGWDRLISAAFIGVAAYCVPADVDRLYVSVEIVAD
jgi:hypothetical protein